MKRKRLAIMLSACMVMTMAVGCRGNNNTPASSEIAAEKEPITAVNFTGETSFTTVQGEPVNLSDLISKAEVETGYNPETVTIQYSDTEFVIDTDADLPENEPDAAVMIEMAKNAKNLMNEGNLPNVTLEFTNVTNKPETLAVQMDLVNSKDKPGTGEIEIPITVVPKEISEVKDLTKNLKISEKLGNYDFDVRAANIQNNVSEDSNIKAVAVKDSDVKFHTPGHYTVTYEVTFKEPIEVTMPVKDNSQTADASKEKTDTDTDQKKTADEELLSVEIPTDVTIVGAGEESEIGKDNVIFENVKPEEKPKKVEEETSKDQDISSESENPALSSESTSTGGASGESTSTGKSSAGSTSTGGSPSVGASSGESSQPAKPAHTHNWQPHYATRHVENWGTVHAHGRAFICNCGYQTCDSNAMREHAKAHILAGEPDNYTYGACPHTTQVDQGYDETYIDYYYCSCGATKNP